MSAPQPGGLQDLSRAQRPTDSAPERTGASVGPEYGALKKAARSAVADVFAAAYQSECRPGGPYGALSTSPVRSAKKNFKTAAVRLRMFSWSAGTAKGGLLWLLEHGFVGA